MDTNTVLKACLLAALAFSSYLSIAHLRLAYTEWMIARGTKGVESMRLTEYRSLSQRAAIRSLMSLGMALECLGAMILAMVSVYMVMYGDFRLAVLVNTITVVLIGLSSVSIQFAQKRIPVVNHRVEYSTTGKRQYRLLPD